jgi:hypothetical protein
MAKRKNTTATPKQTLTPFNQITILCIQYTNHVTASDLCYKIDPSPNNETAEAMADEYIAGSRTILEQLADMPAKTVEEISAKTRIVEYVIDRMAGFGVERGDVELRYLARLADDVRTLVTPMVDAIAAGKAAAA